MYFLNQCDKQIDTDSWREMVKEAVGSDLNLQTEILKSLAVANDAAEAYYFAQFYQIPRDEWPWILRSYVDDNPNGNNFFNVILKKFNT